MPSGGNNNTPAVRLVDLNGDGKADLLVGGQNNSELAVLLSNGDGTFTPAGVFDAGRLGVGLAVGDYSGDGVPDIANTSIERNEVAVLLGRPGGTFDPPQFYFTGQAPVAVEIVDFGSQRTLPDGSIVLGPRDGLPDLVVANSGVAFAVQTVGGAEVVLLPGLADGLGQFTGFGAPIRLAEADAPQSLAVGDVNNDGAPDVAVAQRSGALVIYGTPPVIPENTTPATARDLGAVVHLVEPTLTIVPGREDAYYKLTVPSEALAAAGDEVLDFSALFQYAEGAGLSMELLDANGNVLASGERFRVQAAQGQQLTLHVFGVADAGGVRGAGAYTLVIDVLPQVVAIDAQALLPGVGGRPGGPTTSIVVTLQGDRLDPATAENAANYQVTWFGPDGLADTADDQVIPIGGAGVTQPVVYNAGANVDVASGRTYPTAVRQTVTLLFAGALPAGSYRVELSPAIQTAAFNEWEAGLLAGDASLAGHPVVSRVGPAVFNGARIEATDLVLASTALGDLSVFRTGTPFLTQLHDDMGALLDGLLTATGDDPAITQKLIDQVISRLGPSLETQGSVNSALVIWLDPVSIDISEGKTTQINYDLPQEEYFNDMPNAYVNVSQNMEVIVIANPPADYNYTLTVSTVPATARGGWTYLATGTTPVSQPLTQQLQSSVTSFTLTKPQP